MRDIGFYLVVIGFLLGIAYVSLYSFSWIAVVAIGLLVLISTGAFVIRRRPIYVWIVLISVAALLGGWRTLLAPTELPPQFAPLIDRKLVLQGILVSPPDHRESSTRLTVNVAYAGQEMKVIAVAPPHGSYAVGDEVEVSGTLTRPDPFETGGGRTFAYDAFLAKDGIFALVSPARVDVVGHDEQMLFVLLRILQSARDSFMLALSRALPEPESALAVGLIAGGKQGLGKELLAAFTTAGLIHIVVLSGYNVAIVAEAVLRALGFLPRKVAAMCAGIIIALFVLAAGAGAAALRAGLMALLGLAARATNRTYLVIRALVVSLVVLLLWNPLLLMNDPGFQFSFIATLGLILFAPHFERVFSFVRSSMMREIAASTFAAQVAVLPILLFHTGNLSLVSFGVNLLVLPVIPLAMGLATAAGFVALVLPPPLAPLVLLMGLPAYGLLAYVIAMAKAATGLPFASVLAPAFPFWVVVLTYTLLVFVLAWLSRDKLLSKIAYATPQPI